MSDYNAKNYTEQGGDVTHIGGKLVIEPGAIVEGLPYARYQEDSTATTVAGLKDDLNALILKLRQGGLMEYAPSENEGE